MTGCVLQECSTGSCYTDKSLITSSHKTSTDSLTMSVIIFHIAWIWKGTQGAQTSAKADPQFCRIQRKRSDCAHKNGMGSYFAHAPPLQEGWCNSITFATELQLILVTNKQTNKQTNRQAKQRSLKRISVATQAHHDSPQSRLHHMCKACAATHTVTYL